MPVTRELQISYGSYVVGGANTNPQIHDFMTLYQGYVQTGVKFTFLVTATSEAAFASACIAAEAAFRTPRLALTVTIGSSTILSLSHSAGTGFNSDPRIDKIEAGSSARSRLYTVSIDFGMPADNVGTDYRRDSTVRVTWSPDRRRHIAIDGIYTVNGSTSARDQYTAAIGTYAAAIISAIGGTYDLLEEHVENDDQNKVATFHRLYDEQIVDRNEAEITLFYSPDRRRHVTITGKYSKCAAGSGARATYNADIGAFSTAVLGALGGTYDLQAETTDDNDTDTVITFSRTYDELIGGRKEAKYTISYADTRKASLTFEGTYTTVSAGTSAIAAYNSNFPTWAATVIGTFGLTMQKVEENVQPNDQDNAVSFQTKYEQVIFAQAGTLPDARIRHQELKVRRAKEAPGDSPGAIRPVRLEIDYSADIVYTSTQDLQAIWTAARNWILTSLAATYQTGQGMAVVAEAPSFNPDDNTLTATMTLDIPVNNILLNKIDVTDEVDQGEQLIGVWDGNPMDYYRFSGLIVAVRTIVKTYRIIPGAVPGGSGITYSGPTPVRPPGGGSGGSLVNPTPPSISGANGESQDDPYGFGGYTGVVIRRSQTKTIVVIGLPGNQYTAWDIVYTTVVRLYNPAGTTTVTQ